MRSEARYSKGMSNPSPAAEVEQTDVGSYFVANYPPFSVWTAGGRRHGRRPALESPAAGDVPLGLYLHIPFCRKRCHFCYFRVYTDKNAQEVERLSRSAGARVGAVSRQRRRSPGGR